MVATVGSYISIIGILIFMLNLLLTIRSAGKIQ